MTVLTEAQQQRVAAEGTRPGRATPDGTRMMLMLERGSHPRGTVVEKTGWGWDDSVRSRVWQGTGRAALRTYARDTFRIIPDGVLAELDGTAPTAPTPTVPFPVGTRLRESHLSANSTVWEVTGLIEGRTDGMHDIRINREGAGARGEITWHSSRMTALDPVSPEIEVWRGFHVGDTVQVTERHWNMGVAPTYVVHELNRLYATRSAQALYVSDPGRTRGEYYLDPARTRVVTCPHVTSAPASASHPVGSIIETDLGGTSRYVVVSHVVNPTDGRDLNVRLTTNSADTPTSTWYTARSTVVQAAPDATGLPSRNGFHVGDTVRARESDRLGTRANDTIVVTHLDPSTSYYSRGIRGRESAWNFLPDNVEVVTCPHTPVVTPEPTGDARLDAALAELADLKRRQEEFVSALHAEAESRGFCSEFEGIMRRVGLPGRQVTVPVTVTVPRIDLQTERNTRLSIEEQRRLVLERLTADPSLIRIG